MKSSRIDEYRASDVVHPIRPYEPSKNVLTILIAISLRPLLCHLERFLFINLLIFQPLGLQLYRYSTERLSLDCARSWVPTFLRVLLTITSPAERLGTLMEGYFKSKRFMAFDGNSCTFTTNVENWVALYPIEHRKFKQSVVLVQSQTKPGSIARLGERWPAPQQKGFASPIVSFTIGSLK